MKFDAIIGLYGNNNQPGIPVPDEVVKDLDGGKKPAVMVTIGHYSYRSTIATMGGHFLLPISAEHRKGAGVAAGDKVEVELALDTEPRVIQIPPDFAASLEQAGMHGSFLTSYHTATSVVSSCPSKRQKHQKPDNGELKKRLAC